MDKTKPNTWKRLIYCENCTWWNRVTVPHGSILQYSLTNYPVRTVLILNEITREVSKTLTCANCKCKTRFSLEAVPPKKSTSATHSSRPMTKEEEEQFSRKMDHMVESLSKATDRMSSNLNKMFNKISRKITKIVDS